MQFYHETEFKTFNVPQFEGLSIETVLEFASDKPDVLMYLPDERDYGKLPRRWLCGVVFTKVGEPFRNWVQEKIKARNDYVASKRNLMIDLDPRIAAAFNQSINISSKLALVSAFVTAALISTSVTTQRPRAVECIS